MTCPKLAKARMGGDSPSGLFGRSLGYGDIAMAGPAQVQQPKTAASLSIRSGGAYEN
jgi:hypothetical protein